MGIQGELYNKKILTSWNKIEHLDTGVGKLDTYVWKLYNKLDCWFMGFCTPHLYG